MPTHHPLPAPSGSAFGLKTCPTHVAVAFVCVQLLVERVEVGCGVAGGCQPKEALAVAEYTLAALWTHDRLRDAFCWRALLVGPLPVLAFNIQVLC